MLFCCNMCCTSYMMVTAKGWMPNSMAKWAKCSVRLN